LTTITVSNTAGLFEALATAQGGDTIELMPGAYSGATLNDVSFNSAVTIESANPTDRAIFTGFYANDCNNITFRDLEFSTAGSADPYPFRINSSQNISLEDIMVAGSSDNSPSASISGVAVNSSTNINVINSSFRGVLVGLVVYNDNNVLVENNTFRNLTIRGVEVGGTSNISITGNTFTDFSPQLSSLHPDAIMFQTANTTASASNINVSDNVITRGSGGEIQGIFFRDSIGDLPFINVYMQGNVVSDESFNGIYVEGANGLTLVGNVVKESSTQTSFIDVQDANVVAVDNNLAPYFLHTSDTSLTQSDNAWANSWSGNANDPNAVSATLAEVTASSTWVPTPTAGTSPNAPAGGGSTEPSGAASAAATFVAAMAGLDGGKAGQLVAFTQSPASVASALAAPLHSSSGAA
jgi:parallel beta-helix repeat protein